MRLGRSCWEECLGQAEVGSQSGLGKPTASGCGLSSGGADREHGRPYEPNMRLWWRSSRVLSKAMIWGSLGGAGDVLGITVR